MGGGTNEHPIKQREKKNKTKFVLEFWDRIRDKTWGFTASEHFVTLSGFP